MPLSVPFSTGQHHGLACSVELTSVDAQGFLHVLATPPLATDQMTGPHIAILSSYCPKLPTVQYLLDQ